MKKVALYLRKSRDDNSGETKEETLARHEKMLKEYCRRNDLLIIDIYKEVVSGENIANRPQMQLLLEAVDSGKYDGVACVEVERLSRGNQIDQVEILEVFKHSNTLIYTLQKIYDLNNEDIDEEFFEFSLFMSRREYKIIRRRLLRGRNQAKKEGYFVGSVLPYGYTKEKRDRGFVLIPDDNEKDTVIYLFEQCAAGVSISELSRRLNDRGIISRHGKSWTASSVRKILYNPVYVGKIRSAKGDIYDGKHDPIISDDLFDTVQIKGQQNAARVKKEHNLINPFAGLLWCSECGHAMRYNYNGNGSTFYRCVTYQCRTRSMVAHKVEKAVNEALKAELENFNFVIDNYEKELLTEKEKQAAEIKRLEKALEKQKHALTVACEMLENGVYSADLFKSRSDAIEAKINVLVADLEKARAETINEDERAHKAIPILSKVLEKAPDLSPADRNELYKRIIKRIDYNRTGDDLVLNVELLL